MLGKLLKHELKATSREFSMLYIALLALTVLNKIFLVLNDNTDLFQSDSIIGTIVRTLHNIMILTYVFLCAAVFIITTVLILMRFYNNLTGDEGYLMFTLPVPTWMLIVSKLIAAVLWQIISIFAFIISMIILFWGYDFRERLIDLLKQSGWFYSSIRNSLVFTAVLILFLIIAMLIYNTAEYYFCIAIGHLAKKHRIASSIGAYFLFNFVMQFIFLLISINSLDFISDKMEKLFNLSGKGVEFMKVYLSYQNTFIIVIIIILLVIAAILCYTTTMIFRKRLNLE